MDFGRNRALRPIDPPLGLPALRTVPALTTMERSRKGTRLSVQPVTPEQWAAILELAEQPATTPETG